MKRALAPDACAEPPHNLDAPRDDNGRERFSILHSSFSIRGSAWGLLAGLVSSLCCLGPSAAVLLGLGSSSTLFGLQLQRPLALGIGAALLLAGLALALRRESTCIVRPAARWRRPALLLASFALAYGLLGLLMPWVAAYQEDTAIASLAPPASSAGDLRRATLIIEKMICPPCAANVRGLLKRKPFVHSFVAEEGNETVMIEYDGRQIGARELVRLFPSQFKVTLIDDRASS